MKKLFTLFAVAMLALCAGAQTFEVSISTAGSDNFTSGGQTFTITDKDGNCLGAANKASDQFATYIKFSRNANYILHLPEGLKISKFKFQGVANATGTSYLYQLGSKDAPETFGETDYVFPAKDKKPSEGGVDNSVEHVITFETPLEGDVLFRFGDNQTNAKIFLIADDGMQWDFTTTSENDWSNVNADEENWSVTGNRASYVKALNEEPLIANGVELELTQGLLFTAGSGGKIRFDQDNRLGLNGKGVVLIIPGLKAGQVVTVVAQTASGSDLTRYLSATNLTNTTGFGEPYATNAQYDNIGTVVEPGDVTITTNVGGMNIYSITVTGEGSGEQPELEAVAYLWDFTTTASTDVANLTADATNWKKTVEETLEFSFNRYTAQNAYNAAPLLANGVELELTKGLTFTAKEKKIRVDENYRLNLNGGNIVITTPILKKGQKVKVTAFSSSSSEYEDRFLTATNLDNTTGFGAGNSEYAAYLNTGVVTRDGKVSFTTSAGINILKIEVLGDPELTISDAGWATYVAEYNVDFSSETFTAYKVTELKNDHVNLEVVTEAADGDAILVKGDANTYPLMVKEEVTALSDNLLQAALMPVVADGTQYVLANGTNGIGFYPVTVGATIPAGKGYLVVDGEGVNSLSLGDESNGIENLRQPTPATGIFYNLQGQQVQRPVRGLYIVDGKKVTVK